MIQPRRMNISPAFASEPSLQELAHLDGILLWAVASHLPE
jgi:hypothetical protein